MCVWWSMFWISVIKNKINVIRGAVCLQSELKHTSLHSLQAIPVLFDVINYLVKNSQKSNTKFNVNEIIFNKLGQQGKHVILIFTIRIRLITIGFSVLKRDHGSGGTCGLLNNPGSSP